jgi:hypothetical protein
MLSMARSRGNYDGLQRVPVIPHVMARDGCERLGTDERQDVGPQTSRRYSRWVFGLSAFVPGLSQSRITAASPSFAGIVSLKLSPPSSREMGEFVDRAVTFTDLRQAGLLNRDKSLEQLQFGSVAVSIEWRTELIGQPMQPSVIVINTQSH